MPPRSAASPSSVASTSRQWIARLRTSNLPPSHSGEATRIRLRTVVPASYARSGSSSATSSPSTLLWSSSSQSTSSVRRTFVSSARTLGFFGFGSKSVVQEPDETLTFTPQKTTEELQAWFQERFPGVDLPDKMLLQTVTHESWNHGLSTEGHNRRLSFIGRRALILFLNIFLHANSGSSERAATLLGSPDELEMVLQVSRLGDSVGRALALQDVMRWTPAIHTGQSGPVQTGLFKIRGVTVQALIGAIYHQHGAAVARSFFHANVLPNLGTLDEMTKEELNKAIRAEATSGAAVLQSMAQKSSSFVNAALPDATSRVGQGTSDVDLSGPSVRTSDAI